MSQTVMRIILYITSLSLMAILPFIAINRTRREGRWKIEEMGMLLILYSMPFYAFYSANQFGGPSFITVTKIFVSITLGLFFIKAFFLYRDINLFVKPLQNWISVFIILYPLVAGLSMLQMNPKETDFGVKLLLMTMIPQTIFYLLALNAVSRKSVMRWCLIAIVMGITFACVAGLYELASGKIILKKRFVDAGLGSTQLLATNTGRSRVSSFNTDADLHSQAVCFGLGPLLSFVLLTGSKRNRFLLLLLVALFCVNIIATGSKGGWIGLGTLLMTFAWLMRIQRKGFVIGVAVIVLIVTVISMEVFTKAAILERITGKSGGFSNRARLVDWKLSLIALGERPILGWGLGSSVYGFSKFRRFAPDVISAQRRVLGAHIAVYTLIICEMGTIGLIVALGCYFFSLRYLLLVRKNCGDPFYGHMSVGLFAALLSNIVMGFIHPIGASEIQLVYMAMTANMMLAHRTGVESLRVGMSSPQRNLLRAASAMPTHIQRKRK